MKPRSTLILFLICISIGCYLYFVERHNKTTRERQTDHVLEIERDKVDGISIRSPEAKIELKKKENGQWTMEEPAKDRADSVAVAGLLSTIDMLQSVSAIEVDPKNKEQLKEYGVVDSNTRVKLLVAGKSMELIVGKDTAVEGKCYVYEDGTSQVHAVDSAIKTQLSKKGDDFRDRTLADVTPQKISKATIQSAAGSIDLEKTNSHWSIKKPLQARADDSKVNDTLAKALTAHVDEFVPESGAAASGLGEPRGTLTVSVEGTKEPVVLSIGANPKDEKEKDKTYAKLSTRDATVLVSKSIEALIETKPNDLRDKNLVRLEADTVDRITVEAAGGAKFVMSRKGESWVRKIDDKDAAINAAIPARLLGDVQSTQVTDFVSDVATELPKYGLDQPVLKLTFSSYSSENTAETKAGERPIETILFGKTENGRVYAKLESEPFIVSVPQSLVDEVPKTAIELQDITVFQDKPDELASIEISLPGQGSLSIEKDKDGKWKPSKGDGEVDQAAAQSSINTFANVRAVRWVGPVLPEVALDRPTAIVTGIYVQGDKKTVRKLTTGVIREDSYAAQADGLDGYFFLSAPDFEALVRPLKMRLAPPAGAPAEKPATNIPTIMPVPGNLPEGASVLPPGPALSPTAPSNLVKPLVPATPMPAPLPAPPADAAPPAPDAAKPTSEAPKAPAEAAKE